MLQSKPLQDLLCQALSSNIHTAVIATPQGTLIAHAVNPSVNNGVSSAEAPRRQARSFAAIANVIWKNYANINNIDELWGSPNGDSVEDIKERLMWVAVQCEVVYSLQLELSTGRSITVIPSPTTFEKGIVIGSCGYKGRTDWNDAC